MPAKIKIFLWQVSRNRITSGDVQKKHGPGAFGAARLRTVIICFSGVSSPILLGVLSARLWGALGTRVGSWTSIA